MRWVALLMLIGLMSLVHLYPIEQENIVSISALSLGFLIFAGHIFGVTAERLRLPRITGYMLAGILFGPYLFNFVPKEVVQKLQVVDELALALIAFTAGGELRLKRLKKTFKPVISIAMLQSMASFLLVAMLVFGLCFFFAPFGVISFELTIAIALFFGIVAAATSPAATIAVIVETHSKGPVTNVILGVTVLKDVIILLGFVICMAGVKMLLGRGDGSLSGVAEELLSIVISFGVGILIAVLVALYHRFVRREEVLFTIALSIFIVYMTELLHLHFLLTCIMAGFLVENFTQWGEEFVEAIERSSLTIFIIFFALAGANIDFAALQEMWAIALLLVVGRLLATYVGTTVGAKISGESTTLVRWGWMGFVGQAGIELGISGLVQQSFPGWGDTFRTIVIAAVAMNLFIGPILLKFLLSLSEETAERRLTQRMGGDNTTQHPGSRSGV